MAIRGLTRKEDVTPRFTRLGKIKKGEYNEAKGKPVDLTYFRFVGEGDQKDELERVWLEVFGNEPRMLHIYLPHKTVDENWETWHEEWSKKQGLQHRCDGEVMVQWLNLDTLLYTRDYDQLRNEPCPYHSGEKARTAKKPGCTPVGRLAVIVPEFLEAGYPGYVTLEISSKNDLYNITASLVDAENKANDAGRTNGLQGIPFMLRRVQEEIGVRYRNKEGDMVKSKGTKWMIRLDPSNEWVRAQLESVKRAALGVERVAVQLPAITVDAEPVDVEEPAQEPEPEYNYPGDYTVTTRDKTLRLADLAPKTLWYFEEKGKDGDKQAAKDMLRVVSKTYMLPLGVGYDDMVESETLIASMFDEDLGALSDCGNADVEAIAKHVMSERANA